MKSIVAATLVMLLVVLLGGCSLPPGYSLFPRDSHDILDWVKCIKEGITYSFELRHYHAPIDGPDWEEDLQDPNNSSVELEMHNFSFEILEVVETGSQIVCHVFADGAEVCLIVDDARGQLVASGDDEIDDSDMVILEVPIVAGSSWVSNLNSHALGAYVPDVVFTIGMIDALRMTGFEAVPDAVSVKPRLSDLDSNLGVTFAAATAYWSPNFGWLGEYYAWEDAGTGHVVESIAISMELP